jgi:ABC-type nitrate/sulfonate/bicarbonate transport system permease component
MKVTRVVNASIGVLTLVVSLAASLSRYRHEHAFGPALLLTSAIFGFVAVTLVVSWRRRPAPGTPTQRARLEWHERLIHPTLAIWAPLPSGQRPAFGFLLAVVVGVVLGAAAAPNVDLGPRDDDAA